MIILQYISNIICKGNDILGISPPKNPRANVNIFEPNIRHITSCSKHFSNRSIKSNLCRIKCASDSRARLTRGWGEPGRSISRAPRLIFKSLTCLSHFIHSLIYNSHPKFTHTHAKQFRNRLFGP